MTDDDIRAIHAMAKARGDEMHMAICERELGVPLTVWCPAPIVDGHYAKSEAGRRAAIGALEDWLEEIALES